MLRFAKFILIGLWLCSAATIPIDGCGSALFGIRFRDWDAYWASDRHSLDPQKFYSFMRHQIARSAEIPKVPRSDTIIVDREGRATPFGAGVMTDNQGRILEAIKVPSADSEIKSADGSMKKLRDIRWFQQRWQIWQESGALETMFEKKDMFGVPFIQFAESAVKAGQFSAKATVQDMPISLLDYLRSKNLQKLTHIYDEIDLPKEAFRDLALQEFALPNNRVFEFFVTQGSKLVGYTRFFDGSRHILDEESAFGHREPTTTVSMGKNANASFTIPNYFTPIERTLKNPTGSDSPLASIRNNPAFENKRILEVGRAYFDSSLSESAREDVKKLLFTQMANVLPDLAPEGNLANMILVCNAGPTNARLYRSSYGFVPTSDRKVTQADLDYAHRFVWKVSDQFVFDIKFSHPDFMNQEVKNKIRDIQVLATSADKWINILTKDGYVLNSASNNRWQSLPVHPAYLSGEFY